MPSSSPSSFRRSSRVVARRRGEDPGAGPFGHLDRRDPDAAGPGVDERGLPRLQAPELEEAVVGRAEGHRDAGRVVGARAVGDLPGERFGRGAALGVGAVDADGHGAVPDCEAAHVRAHLADGARALVAHDVRRLPDVAAQAIERVAALDTDRLDVDQDVARADDRIGDVLVAEDVGCSRLVIDRCLHTALVLLHRVLLLGLAHDHAPPATWPCPGARRVVHQLDLHAVGVGHHRQADRPDRLDDGRPAHTQTRPDAPRRHRGRCRGTRRRSPGWVRSAPSTGGADPSVSTSSTIPLSGWPASPRNTERNVVVAAPKSAGHGPSKEWSIKTASPSPSRQKRRLASRSRVTIAEWWICATGPPDLDGP